MELKLTQLTTDTGLTFSRRFLPTRLISYASDRSGEGTLDIWVQQIPRGGPIRVAHHEADDHEPAFRRTGRSIVFVRNDRVAGSMLYRRSVAQTPRRSQMVATVRLILQTALRSLLDRRTSLRRGVRNFHSRRGAKAVSESRPARSPVWSPTVVTYCSRDWRTPRNVIGLSLRSMGGPAIKTGITAPFQILAGSWY